MKVLKGDFKEYGARVDGDGVVFTVSTLPATVKCALIFYDRHTKKKQFSVELTREYSIGNVYSVKLTGIKYNELCYLIDEDGRLHMDPYATSVVGRDIYNDPDNRQKAEFQTYSGIDLLDDFKDTQTSIKPMDTIIYKLHMRGFTYGHKMAESKAGNYKGVISKLSYLKELGVTTIEFMPLYDFEELYLESKLTISRNGHRKEEKQYSNKINYWGYGAASYFAPKASYFGGADYAVANFRKMISEIHKNGMECILEMSFDENEADDLIMDCLKYYVKYFHVDGFHIIGCNGPVERISKDPYLANAKIYYEYIPDDILLREQGNKHLFVYNDSFMAVTRQLQNHMNGSMVQFVNHMRRQNSAYGFVNYMSSVCGFSLWDSYSYGEKHNQPNGEENRDGTNSNFSFNYGVEGKTSNKAIVSNRYTQMRNGFATLLLSQSIPLIVAGDEMAATHEGNNNPYCQDNTMGYTMFVKNKHNKTLHKFVTELALFRQQHKCLRSENPFMMNDFKHLGLPDVSFHGSEPWSMFVGEEQKSLGVLYNGAYADEKEEVYICYNFHYEDVEMALPLLNPGKRWRLIFNTSDYNDKSDFTPKPINNQQSIMIPGSSISVLVGLKP